MSATDVVTGFFEVYRNHDTEQMVDLCDLGADFSYVPFEAWGRQRVVRGDGKVCTIGKTDQCQSLGGTFSALSFDDLRVKRG